MFKFMQDIFNRKNLLQESLEESWAMLEKDKEMFDASVKSLHEKETEIALDIYKLDRQVNQLEQNVRKKVLTHLAVSGPAELTVGLTLVSIISDIERVGDYTKNIYELAKDHPNELDAGNWGQDIRHIETVVSESFGTLIEALRKSDTAKAQKLITNMADVKKTCDKFVAAMIKEEEVGFKASSAITLALYLRFLKRIAGHIQNVTSTIVKPFHLIKYKDQ